MKYSLVIKISLIIGAISLIVNFYMDYKLRMEQCLMKV